ncbi:MAG: 1,4-alpha-glucan branching protein domain-containing protein, partial [Thermodesulfobacteriota bacterium]
YRAGGSWQPPFDTGAGKGPCQRRGVVEFLGENGIEYLITDTHLLKGGEPLGVTMESSAASQGLWERYGGNRTTESNDLDRSPHTLYRLCNSEGNETPVALFTRDPLTNREVAGIDGGYPCDGNYLDFHRRQLPGNLRYWKVTGQEGDLVDRDEYHPDAAFSSIAEQADHFAQLVKETLTAQREQSSEEGILVALFNARLFGQRWFEGPEWLYHTITSLAQDGEVEMVTAGEYLKRKSPSEGVTISEGSWGGRGNHRPWCNESNEWIWRRIYEAEEEMVALVKEYGGIENNLNLNKTLRQAGRELLLLQSSDWQLLVNTPSDRAFAEMRVVRHFEDFKRLAEIARHVGREGALRKNDWAFLQLCMERDEIFPDIEPLWFSGMRLKETVL